MHRGLTELPSYVSEVEFSSEGSSRDGSELQEYAGRVPLLEAMGQRTYGSSLAVGLLGFLLYGASPEWASPAH